MSMSQDLYQQMILEHNKKPRNFGKLAEASHCGEGFNPLCGDHLWVFMKIDSSGLIQDISFEGDGCAISRASASMMTAAVKGKSVEEAQALFHDFHRLVIGELKPEVDQNHKLGRLAIFSGVWKYPARVKCAALAWHTMNGAMVKKERVSTEA